MEKSGPVLNRGLSGLDAAFLYLERKEIPLNVAGVLVFDGVIPFEKFVADIDSRLSLVPRYRQRVVAPACNTAYPSWEDDPKFDIRRHVFHVRFKPPGSDAKLESLAGRILSSVLDRSRPLWDIHIAEGLSGGRGALILRMHHALVDGVAGVALLNVILDSAPKRPRAAGKPAVQPLPPPTDHSLTSAIGDAVYSTASKLIGAEEGIFELAQGLLGGRLLSGLKGLVGLLPELVTAVERLPFNKPCSGDRRFCWADFDFALVQAIRARMGATINDVVLTMLTRALARYVELHGETTVKRLVRVIVPVNLRQDGGESMGNRISFLPVVLPMDVKDPLTMLQGVTARMETMKSVKAAELLALVANVLGAAPPPLQNLFWRGLPQVTFPLPLFNIICSNIPGSREPLYCMGRRMLACYPQVPTGYELGIGCAVQSYAGKLCFGLVSDAHVAPDVTRLRDFLRVAFEEMCLAAGVESAPRQAPAARKAPRRKAARTVAKPVVAARKARPRRKKPAEPVVAAPAPVPKAAPVSAPSIAAAKPQPRRKKPAEPPAASEPAVVARKPEPRRKKPAEAVATATPPVRAASEPALAARKPKPRREKPAEAAPAATVPVPAASEPVVAARRPEPSREKPAEAVAAGPAPSSVVGAAKSRPRRTGPINAAEPVTPAASEPAPEAAMPPAPPAPERSIEAMAVGAGATK